LPRHASLPPAYTPPLHDALPISDGVQLGVASLAASVEVRKLGDGAAAEHTNAQKSRFLVHDAIPAYRCLSASRKALNCFRSATRSEEHTSELQSRSHLVCRLLLE